MQIVERPWIVVAATLGAIGGAVAAATVATLAALAALYGPGTLLDLAALDARIAESLGHPLGFLAAVAPAQLAFGAVALGGALLARGPLAGRLGLGFGRCPWWAFPLFVLATPTAQAVNLFVLPWIADEPSAHLRAIHAMIRAPGTLHFVLVLLTLSIAPAVFEELLFRGYLLRGLLGRWPAAPAILVSAAIFAVAHFDPQHMAGVVPLGIWFAVLTWRSGSILPAVVCHAANNAFSVLHARSTSEAEFATLAVEWTPELLGFLALSATCMLLSALVLWRAPRRGGPAGAPGPPPAG